MLSSTTAAFCSQHPARQVAPPQASPDHFAVRERRGRRKFRKRSRRLMHAFQLAHSQAWASARAENKPVFFLVAEERSSLRRGLILSRNRNFFKERKKERKKCESRGGSVESAAQSHADLLTSVGPLHALTSRSSNCTGKSASRLRRPTDVKRVCEDSSRLVREKTRARLLQSSRFHHLCRFILGK